MLRATFALSALGGILAVAALHVGLWCRVRGVITETQFRCVCQTLQNHLGLCSPFGLCFGFMGFALQGKSGVVQGAALGNFLQILQGVTDFGRAHTIPGAVSGQQQTERLLLKYTAQPGTHVVLNQDVTTLLQFIPKLAARRIYVQGCGANLNLLAKATGREMISLSNDFKIQSRALPANESPFLALGPNISVPGLLFALHCFK